MTSWMCPRCREKMPASQRDAHLQRHRNQAKPTSTARGYGQEHRRLREQWEPIVAQGTVTCRRGDQCLLRDRPEGALILPGEAWELGHDDHDRTVAPAPEHHACNRSTATWRSLNG